MALAMALESRSKTCEAGANDNHLYSSGRFSMKFVGSSHLRSQQVTNQAEQARKQPPELFDLFL